MADVASQPTSSKLPVDTNRFVGRRRELAEAKGLFALTHLVTLTGVGGVGKTRLAVSLARDMQRVLRDGTYFVPLGDLEDPALLGHTIAEAVGLREPSGHWRTETLRNHLASLNLLIVLDNCEHLLSVCAELVTDLLQNCPDLRILTTSREPLGITGESTLSVPPLAVPGRDCPHAAALAQYDAVQLFVDRAASVIPGFRLNEDNHVAIAALCSALDGLPLALELAAVRLRALSPEQIVERLTDRYRLLTGGGRNAPDRQKTLRSLIEWSFDLCSPDERTLWARLSVFSGAVELDAAEGICSDEQLPRSAIFDLIASLVDKSILVRDEHGSRVRYRLLETIREYGNQQLRDRGELAEWRRRHRDWYVNLVVEMFANWIGPQQAERIERLRRDHANIRAGLDFCVNEPGEIEIGHLMASTLYFYWLATGFLSQGRYWLDQLLVPGTPLSVHRAKALYANSCLATLQGDHDAASRMLDEAESILLGANDSVSLSYVTQGRGLAALYADDVASALAYFESALRVFESTQDANGLAFTHFLRALAAVIAGDSAKVTGSHQECQEITAAVGETWVWSYSLWVAGLDAWQQHDYDNAISLVTKSLRLKAAMDDVPGIGECFEALAWINASVQRSEYVATVLGAANTIWDKIGMSLRTLPGLERFRRECVRVARRVGHRSYQAAFRQGANFTLDEAIAFALDRPPKPSQEARVGGLGALKLTRREAEVSRLIAEGLSNRAIANKLVIAVRTAEVHVEHVLAKLGFTSRTQIAAWVAEKGHRVGQRSMPDDET